MINASLQSNNQNLNATFGAVQVTETGDYNALINKPSINGLTLQGNIALSDLGLDASGIEGLTNEEIDSTW